MPKVQVYGANRAQTQVTQGAQLQTRKLDSFAGASIGKALSDAGSASVKFAKAERAKAELLKKKAELEKSHAQSTDTLLNYSRDLSGIMRSTDGAGYLNTRGKDTVASAQNTIDNVETLRKNYLSKLEGEAAKLFDTASRAHENKTIALINAHSSTENNNWRISTFKAESANAVQDAALNFNNDAEVETQLGIAIQAVQDANELAGGGKAQEDAVVSATVDAVVLSVITAATDSSSEEGRIAFDRYSELLSSGKDKIENGFTTLTEQNKERKRKLKDAIKLQGESEVKKAKAAEVVTAGLHFSKFDSVVDAHAAIKKHFGKDVKQAKRVISETNSLFRQRDYAINKDSADSADKLSVMIKDGATASELITARPDLWGRLKPDVANDFLHGKSVPKNGKDYHQLNAMSLRDLMTVDLSKHEQTVHPTELNSLYGKQEDAKNGKFDLSSTTKSEVINRVRKKFIGEDPTEERIVNFNTSASIVISSAAHGKPDGKLNATEMETALKNNLHALISERNLGTLIKGKNGENAFFDKEISLKKSDGRDVLVGNAARRSGLNESDVVDAILFLRANKMIVDVESIRQAIQGAK